MPKACVYAGCEECFRPSMDEFIAQWHDSKQWTEEYNSYKIFSLLAHNLRDHNAWSRCTTPFALRPSPFALAPQSSPLTPHLIVSTLRCL